jgi:predicted transcriptional regulator
MYPASVRTTISLPDDLHAQLLSLARDRRETMSRTVENLVRRSLRGDQPAYTLSRDPETGFVGIEFGRPITEDDVRSLDDE